MRVRHRDAHIFLDHVRRECAGHRFEGDNVFCFLGQIRGETSEAARAIAAHFRLAAIGIVVAEFVISTLLGRFNG